MRRSFPTALWLATLALLGSVANPQAAVSAPDPSTPSPRHSSDGRPGPIAAPVPAARRTLTPIDRTRTWVAPGVRLTRWNFTDARGTVRGRMLVTNPANPRVRMEYLHGTYLSGTQTTTSLVQKSGAVAGVNGDFFDIADTGAPLGIGWSRGLRLLHGPRAGWNNVFWIDQQNRARIGNLPVTAQIAGRPRITITNRNSPTVAQHGIGLYTPGWGRTSGWSWTDGKQARMRQVAIVKGRVVSNIGRLPSGQPIADRLLVGRGDGADALKRLRVGSRVRFTAKLGDGVRPQVAVGGNAPLLAGGRIVTRDDKELHPRTMVGIRPTGRVILLVADGRSKRSRGLTMVEAARLMQRMGAVDALNLDGGGSTTMVSPQQWGGAPTIVNSPSDGTERKVANGLGIRILPQAAARGGR